jgi:hypothetical protein
MAKTNHRLNEDQLEMIYDALERGSRVELADSKDGIRAWELRRIDIKE